MQQVLVQTCYFASLSSNVLKKTQSGNRGHSSIFRPVRQMQQRCLEHKKALEDKQARDSPGGEAAQGEGRACALQRCALCKDGNTSEV